MAVVQGILRAPFHLWNMNRCQAATVPGAAAAADVPGHVKFVANWVDCQAVGPFERKAIFLRVKRIKKSDDLLLSRPDVELYDSRTVAITAAVCTGNVVQVAADAT